MRLFSLSLQTLADWYNGTIKGQTWATRARDLSYTAGNTLSWEYNYDTRGQLLYGQFSSNLGGTFHSGIEWMTYDRNGNIKRKTRSYAMSTLTNDQYGYPSNSNRLAATINGSKRTSYTYNAMGQMTAIDRTGYAASTNALLDHQAVTYNADGLVKEIRNGDNVVYFKYDPSGMLVEKLSIIAGTPATTRYARDASGNVLAVLKGNWGQFGHGNIDFPVYASSRIGSLHSSHSPTETDPAARATVMEYELTDHLGNVRATFTRSTLATKVTLASSADYYPYGTKIPGSWTRAGGAYRYGYQGQYAEDNTDETGYSSFEARMLDNERARWFVPDPANQYWSGYVAMGNNPVSLVDPDGRFAEKLRAQFSAWRHGGEYGQNKQGEHYAVWGNSREGFEYSNFGKTETLSNYMPDFIGVSVGYNFIVGGGAGQSQMYGWIKDEGFTVLNTVNTGSGFDVSANVSLSWGDYYGEDKPTRQSLTAAGSYTNVGYGSVSGGTWHDVSSDEKRNLRIGRYWNGSSVGLSLGSKTVLGGSAGTTYTW